MVVTKQTQNDWDAIARIMAESMPSKPCPSRYTWNNIFDQMVDLFRGRYGSAFDVERFLTLGNPKTSNAPETLRTYCAGQ